LEAKGSGDGTADPTEEEDEDEGFLGTRDPSMESRAPSQQPAAKGKGRGRKKAQDNIKRELDEEGMPKETKAERKRRERKEAAEAAAMADLQAIKAKARARENELASAQEEGDDDDQDAHVPRSSMYDDDSEDQDFGHDRRIFDASDDDRGSNMMAAELDEEALARRQEKEYEAKRRAIWDLIAHRQIREVNIRLLCPIQHLVMMMTRVHVVMLSNMGD